MKINSEKVLLPRPKKYKQKYCTRSCYLESSLEDKYWVNSCLKSIKIAFSWKKPAIISSHRVNYMSILNEENISQGLRQIR